ncbi:MAG: YHYH protein [Ilumatobacter sp.]
MRLLPSAPTSGRVMLLCGALSVVGCGSGPDPAAQTTAFPGPPAEAAPGDEAPQTINDSAVASESADREPTATESAPADPLDPGGVVDITGVNLVSTDANCSTRTGEYSSMVIDVSNGNEFQGELSITADAGTCTLVSNQIPNHDISVDADFANDASAVTGAFSITDDPTVNAEPTELGFTAHAVMLNGVIWEAYPAACFDEGPNPIGREAVGCGGNLLDHPWRYNVGSPENAFSLDAFSAHVQPDGLYHYHSTPQALYEIDCNGTAASPVIGFARDGFPIYGPCFADDNGSIRAAQSGYELQTGVRAEVVGFTTPYAVGNVTSSDYNGQFIGDYTFSGSGDLDECNGMIVDGQYGYYVTGAYPYVIACYRGTPSETFGPP